MTNAERFWSRVNKTDTCWLWVGSVNNKGYGTISMGGVSKSSHRLSYEFLVGPIPQGLVLDHLCRVRNCVNPDHLEPVTQQENLRRGPTTLPSIARAKTRCTQGHDYTPENTYIDGVGKRHCKECRRVRCRAYAARNREMRRLVLGQ